MLFFFKSRTINKNCNEELNNQSSVPGSRHVNQVLLPRVVERSVRSFFLGSAAFFCLPPSVSVVTAIVARVTHLTVIHFPEESRRGPTRGNVDKVGFERLAPTRRP